MSVTFDEVTAAVNDAERAIRQANIRVEQMTFLVRGRLRYIDVNRWSNRELLADLKRELSQYNATTGQWKN
jgi:hypothetical protein